MSKVTTIGPNAVTAGSRLVEYRGGAETLRQPAATVDQWCDHGATSPTGPPPPTHRSPLMLSTPRGRRVRLALAAAASALLLSTPGTASAATFGYGDNRPDMFADARWQSLPLKDVRRTVDWDTSTDAAKTSQLDVWMGAARGAGARPLLAIDRSWSAGKGTSKPSVAQYSRLIRWLKTRYPWWNTLTPWNEANYILQPTVRNPKLAFKYWQAAKKACPGCTVTSPAILTGKGISNKFLPAFKKLAKGKVKIWAVHVYGDQNRFTDASLKRLERSLKGQLWVTETAGWVKFGDSPKWGYDEARAAKVISHTFKMAARHKRATRWYFWQWLGAPRSADSRWDSGVLNADGSARPGFHALVAGLRR